MTTSPSKEPPATPRPAAAEIALGAILIVAAGLLRWRASLGEFWLDEVWTWQISQKLTWPGGLVYQLQEENNHYLNTLWIWLVGQNAWWGWYRLLPVLCGTISVALAWKLAAPSAAPRAGTTPVPWIAPWIAAALSACSYLLIHYSSEARGYAYAVVFTAWAFLELPQTITDQLQAQAYGSSVELGRARLRFSLAAWTLLKLRRSSDSGLAMPVLWKTFFPSGAFIVALYLIDLKNAVNGGGDVYPLWQVILETLSLTGGGPHAVGMPAVVTAGLVLGAFGQGLRVLRRDHDDRWVFYLLVVVVMPLLLLVVLRRAEVYPRYFILSVFFLIQAAAIGLADLLHQSWAGRVVAVVTILASMIGNGQNYERLANLGRGSYMKLLQRMVHDEQTAEIVVMTDHPFRHEMMCRYYEPRCDLRGKTLKLVPPPEPAAPVTKPAPWLLVHKLDPAWRPKASITTRQGVKYQLQQVEPYAGLSGWGLALYRIQSWD
jgi:hypothetical protein